MIAAPSDTLCCRSRWSKRNVLNPLLHSAQEIFVLGLLDFLRWVARAFIAALMPTFSADFVRLDEQLLAAMTSPPNSPSDDFALALC